MSDAFTIQIASAPGREKVYAEIWVKDVDSESAINAMDITNEHNVVQVHVYPREDGKPWIFEYGDLMHLLERTKSHLVGD